MSATSIIFQILPYIFSLVVAFVAYWLGLKSQRIQALREYITNIVQAEYPALSSEIKRNVKKLDDFFEYPLEFFGFRELDQFYNDGFDVFMKRHHEDLFLSINYLKKEIAPKLNEFNHIVGESIQRISDKWISELTIILASESKKEILASESKKESRNIVHDLIHSVNPNYVFNDLLNNRKNAVRKKIEKCILNKIVNIFQQKSKPYPLGYQPQADYERARTYVNYDKVSKSLLEKTKPEIARILEVYLELKKQTDKKIKLELLPLLHKYISNPI